MEKFIQFCKKLGVHENLLFESDDLGKSVLGRQSIINVLSTKKKKRSRVRLIADWTYFACLLQCYKINPVT